MKLFLFFKKTDGLTPILYAFTNDKELSKSFKEERNMDIFIAAEEEVSKKEYSQFQIKHKNFELGRRGYLTKPSSSDSLKKRNHVYVTSTYAEEMDTYVKSDQISELLMKCVDPISVYFNDELLEALETLGYFKILKWAYNSPLPFLDGVLGPEDVLSFNDIFPDSEPDMLSVFIKLFGYTMRKG